MVLLFLGDMNYIRWLQGFISLKAYLYYAYIYMCIYIYIYIYIYICIYVIYSCGSVLEHCVSSAKGCGFNSQGTHILQKKCIAWMHCKSLWIKVSAKYNIYIAYIYIHKYWKSWFMHILYILTSERMPGPTNRFDWSLKIKASPRCRAALLAQAVHF